MEINNDLFKNFNVEITQIKHQIWEYLDALKCLFIIDGFDELPLSQQSKAYGEIGEMSHFFNKSRIIVTSRTSNFNYSPSVKLIIKWRIILYL